MKHKIAVSAIACLLLCIPGFGRPINESRLLGAWQFDVLRTTMTLDTNHTYTLKADDGRTTLGEWKLQGNRLITIGQTWTNASGAIRVALTNDTRITELTDSRMILQNWGGEASTLTRIVANH
jgi:hypothetical protein